MHQSFSWIDYYFIGAKVIPDCWLLSIILLSSLTTPSFLSFPLIPSTQHHGGSILYCFQIISSINLLQLKLMILSLRIKMRWNKSHVCCCGAPCTYGVKSSPLTLPTKIIPVKPHCRNSVLTLLKWTNNLLRATLPVYLSNMLYYRLNLISLLLVMQSGSFYDHAPHIMNMMIGRASSWLINYVVKRPLIWTLNKRFIGHIT